MMRLAIAWLLLMSPTSVDEQVQQTVSARPLVFTAATVIDVKSGQPTPDMTIVVVGNRISMLGPSGRVTVPAGAQIIDASGKHVIPGLWDMHAHLGAGGAATSIDMRLLVANGVTGIREMWSDCYPEPSTGDCLIQRRAWQRQIEAGELTGPRLLALASWPVNGPRGLAKGAPAFFGAANAEQGRQLARHFAERKVDFIKIYPNIPRDGFLALANEARRLGLGVAGHETLGLSAIDASDAGQKSFEHARVFLYNCFPGADDFRVASTGAPTTPWRRRMVDEFDPATCQRVFSTFVRNNTRYVPTHLTRKMDAFSGDRAYREDARAKYIPKAQWNAWNRDADGMAKRDSSAEARKATMDFYIKGLEITGAAHRAGVKVMLGTDAGDSYVFPGFATHDELQELVKAGLNPAEALKTATWNGAEFLERTSDFGTIEPGKLADLLVLEANPLTDIRNTRKIGAVVLNGRYLDRSALDRLLSDAEAAAKR